MSPAQPIFGILKFRHWIPLFCLYPEALEWA